MAGRSHRGGEEEKSSKKRRSLPVFLCVCVFGGAHTHTHTQEDGELDSPATLMSATRRPTPPNGSIKDQLMWLIRTGAAAGPTAT